MSIRSGVIKGRNFGTSLAKCDVVIFVDSHCEFNEGWLPPLLSRIDEDRRRVVSLTIDVIDENTLQELPVTDELYGAFDWSYVFARFVLDHQPSVTTRILHLQSFSSVLLW
ncbi:hypothetical protein B4U80_04035 [Leptotrombidium deliense]|uniref:Glycosyltransferase 2-like domain-containing protein n=1 Tax=Leptotrombidium deliense TaxID=299467 RepID=A0A443S4E7_9ACAR|nr:hypothetical protein B4U80_04035 [Leptotrombidium deliense]